MRGSTAFCQVCLGLVHHRKPNVRQLGGDHSEAEEGGGVERDWCVIAEQPAPAPHLAHPEGCAALRIVLVTVPRVSRCCEHFPDGFGIRGEGGRTRMA